MVENWPLLSAATVTSATAHVAIATPRRNARTKLRVRRRIRLPAIENRAQRVKIDADYLAIRIRKRRVLLQEIDIVDRAHQTLAFGLPLSVFGRDHFAQAFQILHRCIVTTALLLIQLVALDDVTQILVGALHPVANLIAQFRDLASMYRWSEQRNRAR